MATNPFEQPLQSEQARQTPTAGNPFDQPLSSEQSAPQQQPGFLSRAYEASPLPGVIDAAKGAVSDFVNAPVQGEQNFHAMVDSLKNGNFREAAGHAAQLLVGDANPFQDAAKSVISGIVKDAHQTGRDVAAQIPGANAAANYVKDVKAGNTPAAIGDVVGGVSSVAPFLLGDEASAGKVSDAAGKVADTASDVAGKVKPLVSEDAAATKAQPAAQGAVRGAAEDTATAENVTPKPATSVRDAIQNTADAVLDRSKSTYQQLDQLSGGRWQRFSDSIKNLRDKANEVAGIDDDKFDEFTQRAADIEKAQSDLVDSLVRDGKIDADTAESAKSDYRKAQALTDLSQQIRNSTSGLRPEIGKGIPETVDPAKLAPRLDKMIDSGRLQQALGEDGASMLRQRIDQALQTKQSAIKTAKLVKSVLKYGGYAAGAGAAGHLVLGLAGGH